jgi:hypothetical protein
VSLSLDEALLLQVRFLVEPRPSGPPPCGEWEELAALARQLDLEVALRDRDEGAPDEVRARVERRYREVQAGNLLRVRAFRRIAGELEEAGIPVVPLKGVDLLETIWSDPGLRPMQDVDLLVPPGRRAEAGEALRAAGHELVGKGPCQEAYRRDSLAVELHDVLFAPPAPGEPDDEAVWERTVAPPGAPGRRLSPEDRMVYMLAHLFLGEVYRHRTPLLLRDLAALVARGPVLDWRAIRERSEAASLYPFVVRGVGMLREVLGERCPEIPALAEPRVGRRAACGFRWHEAAVREALASGRTGVGKGVGRLTLLLFWVPLARAAGVVLREGFRLSPGRLGRIGRLVRAVRAGRRDAGAARG